MGVRSRLPDLLEDDGSVMPDEAVALHGHMAVCSSCKREFRQMQQVVASIESLPLLDLPIDLAAKVHDDIVARSLKPRPTEQDPASQRTRFSVDGQAGASSLSFTAVERQNVNSVTTAAQHQVNLRSTIISLLVVIGIAAMPWCRAAMGVNFEVARRAIASLGHLSVHVPVVGWVVTVATSVLMNIVEGSAAAFAANPAMVTAYVFDAALICAAAWFMRRRIPGYTGF